MKYIVLKTEVNGLVQKVPIIFPNFMVHMFVAKYVAGLLIREHKHDPEITVSSAGSIELGEVFCSGESETCKVKSDPEDAELIKYFEYTQGIEGTINPADLLRKNSKI